MKAPRPSKFAVGNRSRIALWSLAVLASTVLIYELFSESDREKHHWLPGTNVCLDFADLEATDNGELMGPELYVLEYDEHRERDSSRHFGSRLGENAGWQWCVMEIIAPQENVEIFASFEIEIEPTEAMCSGSSSGIPQAPWRKSDLGEHIDGFEQWDRDIVNAGVFSTALDEYGSSYVDSDTITTLSCLGAFKVQSQLEVRYRESRAEEESDRIERELLEHMITVLYEFRTSAHLAVVD